MIINSIVLNTVKEDISIEEQESSPSSNTYTL